MSPATTDPAKSLTPRWHFSACQMGCYLYNARQKNKKQCKLSPSPHPGHQMINCRPTGSSNVGGRLEQRAGEAAPWCTQGSGAPSLLEAAVLLGARASTMENGTSSYLGATVSLLLLFRDSPTPHGLGMGQGGGKAPGHSLLQLLAILIASWAEGYRQPRRGHCPVGD